MPENIEPNAIDCFNLCERVAIVTGATGHLGGAMARALAEVGAQVVISSRDQKSADKFAATLPNTANASHFGMMLDHMDERSINSFISQVRERTGRIDILVNNALEPIASDWSNASAEEFNRHLINITGCFLLARCVRDAAVLRKAPASIVMIGSMYGCVASYPDVYEGISSANPAAYQAMKGGLIQLTRHLAVHWARDRVRVNCLSPGPFPASNVSPVLVERLKHKSPMGRMGEPHELKGALLLLATDAGSYITGQNLVVDGGWTAW